MIELDFFNNPEPLSIYILRVDGSILGCLDEMIEEKSASLSVGLNEQYVLEFDIAKSEDNKWYDYIAEGMYLFVENVGLFKMKQPSISMDGVKETKSVQAYSTDSELEDKNIELQLNMGLKTSQEYLVEYEEGETENLVNPYTGVPYDWIVMYNTFPDQLTAFNTLYTSGHFGDPDASGDTTVTDEALIAELTDMFNLVPRLKSKITYVDNEDGSKDSVLTEYVIITYDPDDTEIVTQYILTSEFGQRITDLITYYTTYKKQLSLLDIVLEKTGGDWTVGKVYGVSDKDYSLANAKYQFDINESIYSFLTQTLAQTTNCVVTFDILNRKVNMTPVEEIGNDTGIVMSYDNLVNALDINTDEDRLSTRLKVAGGEELDIARVNFGSNYVDDITYKLNAVGDDGKRIYVSDNLANKYMGYIDDREEAREQYIQFSKDYESYSEQISEIENRVPLDSVRTDWSTFTMEELTAALTSFKNLLATLKSLYKDEYGTAGLNTDGSINEDYIKTTPYWYDYFGYVTTIDEIECAISVFPYYNDTEKWTPAQKAEYEEKIKAWETEWSLYGTKELQAKIDTYRQNMDLMLADQNGDESGNKSAVIPMDDANYIVDSQTMTTGWTHGTCVSISDGVATFTPSDSDGDIDAPTSSEYNAYLDTPDWKTTETYNINTQMFDGKTNYSVSFEYKSTEDRTIYIGIYGADSGGDESGYGSGQESGSQPHGTTIRWSDRNTGLTSTDGEWVKHTLDSRTIRAGDFGIESINVSNLVFMLLDEEGSDLYIKNISMNVADDYVIKTWDMLTPAERSQYGNAEILYYYDSYMEYYNNWKSASDYLITLNQQVDNLNAQRDSAQDGRKEIVDDVKLENCFTADECRIIYRLFRDAEYSNENILSTSIDSSSEKIDRMVELLEDAKDQASLVSRPQLTFSVSADNLLALPDFTKLWDSFIPGNYILVQYKDDTYVKLRMLGYKFNPRVLDGDGFEITFSNFVRSRAYYRDWASIFGDSYSSSTSSYGSSGGGSGEGTYGESDDIDVTISNTMLAKLLNSETFGSRVTDIILDTIDVNKITARLATFGGLSNGSTVIDGKCIQTGYVSSYDYPKELDGSIENEVGTIINLSDGNFNFAGGKIKYNSQTDKLEIYSDDLNIGSSSIDDYVDNRVEEGVEEGVSGKLDIYSENASGGSVGGNINWNGSRLSISSGVYAIDVSGELIDFKYNGNSTASIDRDKLVIGKTVVIDEMQVGIQRDSEGHRLGDTGKWSWRYDNHDDSLYLKWIG